MPRTGHGSGGRRQQTRKKGDQNKSETTNKKWRSEREANAGRAVETTKQQEESRLQEALPGEESSRPALPPCRELTASTGCVLSMLQYKVSTRECARRKTFLTRQHYHLLRRLRCLRMQLSAGASRRQLRDSRYDPCANSWPQTLSLVSSLRQASGSVRKAKNTTDTVAFVAFYGTEVLRGATFSGGTTPTADQSSN